MNLSKPPVSIGEPVLSKNNISSSSFLTGMIDFSDVGDMSLFTDKQQISYIEKQMDRPGFYKGGEL